LFLFFWATTRKYYLLNIYVFRCKCYVRNRTGLSACHCDLKTCARPDPGLAASPPNSSSLKSVYSDERHRCHVPYMVEWHFLMVRFTCDPTSVRSTYVYMRTPSQVVPFHAPLLVSRKISVLTCLKEVYSSDLSLRKCHLRFLDCIINPRWCLNQAFPLSQRL